MFSYPNLDTSLLAQENATQNQILAHGFHPNFEHDGFDELLLAIQLLPNKSPSLYPPEPPPLLTPNSEANVVQGRKRTVRRDRHSKIVTAKGPRDRRMRLSLKVAKKFFDLQDVLGFDKASKTVEWLLNKSKDAIKTITNCGSRSEHRGSSSGNAKIESSTTECEVDSATPGSNTRDAEVEEEEEENELEVAGGIRVNKTKARKTGAPRKALCDPMTAKELRAKARVRAKERTRGKRMWMSTMSEDNNLPKQFQSEVEEHNYYEGVTAMEGTSEQYSLPITASMGHQHGGFSTYIDYNHNMYPPLEASLMDHWNVNSSSFGGQKGSLDAHLLTKGWEGFNSW